MGRRGAPADTRDPDRRRGPGRAPACRWRRRPRGGTRRSPARRRRVSSPARYPPSGGRPTIQDWAGRTARVWTAVDVVEAIGPDDPRIPFEPVVRVGHRHRLVRASPAASDPPARRASRTGSRTARDLRRRLGGRPMSSAEIAPTPGRRVDPRSRWRPLGIEPHSTGPGGSRRLPEEAPTAGVSRRDAAEAVRTAPGEPSAGRGAACAASSVARSSPESTAWTSGRPALHRGATCR